VPDVGQVLKERLQFGQFFVELQQRSMTRVKLDYASTHGSDLSVDCVPVKRE
jgi:hypothetical protein